MPRAFLLPYPMDEGLLWGDPTGVSVLRDRTETAMGRKLQVLVKPPADEDVFSLGETMEGQNEAAL